MSNQLGKLPLSSEGETITYYGTQKNYDTQRFYICVQTCLKKTWGISVEFPAQLS